MLYNTVATQPVPKSATTWSNVPDHELPGQLRLPGDEELIVRCCCGPADFEGEGTGTCLLEASRHRQMPDGESRADLARVDQIGLDGPVSLEHAAVDPHRLGRGERALYDRRAVGRVPLLGECSGQRDPALRSHDDGAEILQVAGQTEDAPVSDLEPAARADPRQ